MDKVIAALGVIVAVAIMWLLLYVMIGGFADISANRCLEADEARRYHAQDDTCQRWDGSAWQSVYGELEWQYNELGEGE